MSRLWGTSLHENARFYIRSMEEQTYKYFTANGDRMKKKNETNTFMKETDPAFNLVTTTVLSKHHKLL